MPNDPSYVRLVDRMARSTQLDMRSGWSIAGLDVREFPSDDYPAAQAYVRDAIRRGTIEGCSKAEYEEVYGDDPDTDIHDYLGQAGVVVKPLEIPGHFQEAHVSGLAETNRHRIEAARGLGSAGASYGDTKVRRAAILKAQRAMEDGDDLEDETDDDTGTGEGVADEATENASTGRRTAAQKRAAAKSSKNSTDDDS